MLSIEKYNSIQNGWKNISKQDMIERIKRGIHHTIRNTKYYDMVAGGSYVEVLCQITGLDKQAVMTYNSKYDKKGNYKHKFPLIYLAKIAIAFSIGLEYLVGASEEMEQTPSAQEYIDVCQLYKIVGKMTVSQNVKFFKGGKGINTNEDIAMLLGLSPNTVKANLSSGPRVANNMFTIEQIYKLAEGFDVDIERMFKKIE